MLKFGGCGQHPIYKYKKKIRDGSKIARKRNLVKNSQCTKRKLFDTSAGSDDYYSTGLEK